MARQAELRRAEGNACFRKARLGAAIDCYTEASATFLPIPFFPIAASSIRHKRIPTWSQPYGRN